MRFLRPLGFCAACLTALSACSPKEAVGADDAGLDDLITLGGKGNSQSTIDLDRPATRIDWSLSDLDTTEGYLSVEIARPGAQPLVWLYEPLATGQKGSRSIALPPGHYDVRVTVPGGYAIHLRGKR